MTAAPLTLIRRITPLAVIFTGMMIVVGCSDGTGLPKRYPVSGNVTYNGQPVETGTITFAPVDPDSRAASGTISGGSYYLTTAIDGDGALPGEYRVSITSRDVNYDAAMSGVQGGSPKQDDVAKAFAEAKDLVPAKYSLPDTSGLTYTVESGSNRNVDFDLTD
ncbi:hypothetical protein [Tautonia marina]|uniref:hypothetical protein n=1 Tax=Tautonia marina TaxID=2653855 RepID=UPI0012611DFD|nr:hypothetical protein [Tautonia marina]